MNRDREIIKLQGESDPNDDPFSFDADPYPPMPRTNDAVLTGADKISPHSCQCASPSRRRALAGLGLLATLPMVAAAEPFAVPCVQEKQQITPCRHKFCRHYAGAEDYHGR